MKDSITYILNYLQISNKINRYSNKLYKIDISIEIQNPEDVNDYNIIHPYNGSIFKIYTNKCINGREVIGSFYKLLGYCFKEF